MTAPDPSAEVAQWGQRLRATRRAMALPLRTVAEQAGIDFSYLSRIETGHFPPPSTRTIRKLAAVLDADADQLIGACGKTDAHYSHRQREQIDALRAWLKRKLEAERDLLRVAEKASDAYLAYENGSEYEQIDAMAALGDALAEYAAKHKPATVVQGEAEQAQLVALVGEG